jgi:hypothetical protein
VRTIRVNRSFLRQEVFGYLVRGDPNMVVSGQVDLIDRAILFAPICEFDEAVLLRNFGNRANDGIA